VLRGIISGGFWGIILSGLGLGAASLLAPQPAGNRPPDRPQVVVQDVTNGDLAAGPAPEAMAVAEGGPELPQVPQVTLPEGEAGLPSTDTAPADVTATTGLDIALPVPGTGDAPQVAADAEEPVLPNPQSLAPQVPLREEDLVLSTEPAAPPAPVVVVEEAAPEVVVVAPDDVVGPLQAPESVDNVAPAVEEDGPVLIVPEAGDINADISLPAVRDAPVLAEPEVSVTEPVVTEVEPAPPAEAEPALEIAVTPETAPDDAAPDDAIVSEDDTTAEPAAPARVTLLGDGAALPSVESGVRVNRPEAEAEAAVTEPAPEPSILPETGGPALVSFAAEYENTEEKPLLAVVLIDDGSISGAVPLIAGLPFSVSIAVDPSGPDARARMAEYRDAGIEVLALIRLPVGAQPTDVEVSFESIFASLPEAVAVLDAGEGGMANAAVAQQAMGRLAADGRGLVSVSQGLNAAMRAAEAAQVPAATVYRDLDSADQDARVISRFLDQAAFRARQESGVILLGRVRADTISALILWGTQNRAGQVSVAPVSAVLLAQ